MRRLLFALLLLVHGCDGGVQPQADAGPGSMCTDDMGCDDGLFCNGTESCAPDADGADALGCVQGARPCAETERCVEEMDLCRASCDVSPDADGDGVDAIACGGADCDDLNPNAFPGNLEVCDALDVDEDCDPSTFGSTDADGDGFVDAACCNVLSDGERVCGNDCGDLRRDVRPGNTEACDALDNDCDGAIDETVIVSGFADADHDLHGDAAMPLMACPGAPGFAIVGDDCDDEDPEVHGAQLELCDGKDNNCNGMTDESPAAVSWYPDEDDDGFGSASGTVIVSCTPVAGHSVRSSDCDDTDRAVSPAAREVCNGRDDDCNGAADAVITPGNTEDDDGDGFADMACGGNDCNDSDGAVHPGAIELCDGIDNDCDGVADGADAGAQWYLDLDGDGFGDGDAPAIESCDPQPMRVTRGGDCDDGNAAIRPGVPDPCGGGDQDCDGDTDESGVRFAFYVDADGDGFGSPTGGYVFACEAPDGRSGLPSDCDDSEPVSYPGAPERCDTEDNDCDETVDEEAETDWYPDADRDGSGAVAGAIETCSPPSGYVTTTGDCDDIDPLRAPTIAERCDGIDNDCDTTVDDGADATCTVANGVGSCGASACEIDSCASGYDDCDGLASTGCEVRTARDPFNCGACLALCGFGDSCGTTAAGTCDESPFIALSMGANYSLALRASGGTAVWGDNAFGQIGDGSSTDRFLPVAGPRGLVQIEGAERHTCGRTAAGRVWCWGEGGSNGRLGNGRIEVFPAPIEVPGIADAIDLSTAQEHTCVVRAGGTIACWGRNEHGELGVPVASTPDSYSRVPVEGTAITDAIEVFVGGHTSTIGRAEGYTCALRPLGGGGGNRVSCWGANEAGQLGNGMLGVASATPVDVVGLPADVVAFANGPNSHTTCVRTGGGLVYCWGYHADGANGASGNLATASVVASASGPVSGVVEVNGGGFGTCALRGTGVAGAHAVWCWGTGQAMGRNVSGASQPPAAVLEAGTLAPIVDARAVSVGRVHACAVRSDNSIWCWGNDSDGQVGNDAAGTAAPYAVRTANLP